MERGTEGGREGGREGEKEGVSEGGRERGPHSREIYCFALHAAFLFSLHSP